MSGSKTVTLPRKVTKETRGHEEQNSTAAMCCEKIRERAYYNWVSAGCPCGDGVEFWLQAENELAEETHSSRLKS